MVGHIVGNEREMMRKEVFVGEFEVLSGSLPNVRIAGLRAVI
jgi:hypothetical protein